MPKLWNKTIEAHRQAVRDATMEATAALVAKAGLASVTMSQIAEDTGIGRATLYKYFPDVESILVGWHQRQITGHLERLAAVRDSSADALGRLEAVLEAYAFIRHEHPDTELAGFLHRSEHVARAQRHLDDFIGELLSAAAAAGDVRDDVAQDVLIRYCLHALSAAGSLSSKAAISQLVAVTLDGLRPPGAGVSHAG